MQVGRYRILRTIGQGGMAEVFEAVAVGEEGFQRRVALKRILPGHQDDPSFLRMFLDEAQIASSLHHSNVVAVLDFGVVDGLPFQVLELVEGTDLRSLVRFGTRAGAPLPVELALHVCTEVAHALDHAHNATDAEGRPLGIVHRDVSPSNVLVSWGGEVKLADFGIAFARHRREETRTGVVKGKLLYSAPEQVLQGEIEPRTDVFALGCVLHELVAGASPLAGDEPMPRLLAGRPLELHPDLPEDVRRIVEHAVRREKTARWPTAAAMADAAGRALAERLHRDAKSAMREWMEKVRGPGAGEASPRPRRGRLDELIDAEFVLGASTGGVRRFESIRTAETRADSPAARAVMRPAAGPAEEAASSPPARRRWALFAALGLVAAGVGLGAWQVAASWVGRSENGAIAGEPKIQGAQTPGIPLPGPAVLPTESTTSPAPSDAAPGDGVPPAGRRGPRADGTGRATRVSGSGDANATGPQPDQGSIVESGFLVIGGAGAFRAEIFVDGRSQGYAPKRIELPLGEHSVELVAQDGRRKGPRRIAITARHTPSSPARWQVEGE